MQHVMLHATWYEETAQLLGLTELKSHFILALFYWLNYLYIPMKEEREKDYPEKTPGDELQKG